MRTEQDFYKALNAVPPVPGSLYPKVAGKIRRREIAGRSLWLLAACIVVAAGVFNYRQFTVSRANEAHAEASAHLQNIGDYFTAQDIIMTPDETEDTTDNLIDITDYFNGSLITQDMEMYAIVSADFL